MKKSKSLAINIDYSPIIIKTPKDMSGAAEVLSRLNKTYTLLTKEKEKLTKPLNETLREIRSRYKDAEIKLETAIAHVRGEMASYQMRALIAQKQAVEKASEKLSGGEISIEDAVNAVRVVSNVVTSSQGSGTVRFRKDYKVVVKDIKNVPKEYFDINLGSIKKALIDGKEVPGAVLEEVQIVVNTVK